MNCAHAPASHAAFEHDAWAREELCRFVRHCRGRLRPPDVGLPSRGTRRVVGLRREEVAELANVSATWYTSFELGGADRVSARFIGTVARALRMNDAERTFLFALAKPPNAVPAALLGREMALRAVTDGEGDAAIALLDGGLRFVGANRLFRALFGDVAKATGSTHLPRRVFEDAAIRGFVADWDALAAVTCGALRMQMARGDAGALEAFAALRDDPDFRACWSSATIVDPRNTEHVMTVVHARAGCMRLRANAIGIHDSSTIMLIVVAADDDAARAIASVRRQHGDARLR
ncbi:MAG TPA: helix-turn-helix domain-containing protein [Candidatus Elarobacter sp.]|nr:helix-turn-helix domain-containing protein [Candidatus Elarobacter sp.]